MKERNSTTGFYTSRVDIPFSQPAGTKLSCKNTSGTQSSVSGSLGDSDEVASQDECAESDILEDLLSSPHVKPEVRTSSSEVLKTARAVIHSHKEAMTNMLDMLKDEM